MNDETSHLEQSRAHTELSRVTDEIAAFGRHQKPLVGEHTTTATHPHIEE